MKKEMKKKTQNENMTRSDKGKMFLRHCYNHPLDVLRLGKATVLYGAKGLKARAGELARNEWEKQRMREECDEYELLFDIKFSFVMSVCDIDADLLKCTIQSIEKQTYGNWEICLTYNASVNADLREYLKKLEGNRIKVKCLNAYEEISSALNEAANMATGDYLLFVDAADELHSKALHEFGRNIQKTNADIIYSDMKVIDETEEHMFPVYKPDWSPDLMLAHMYLEHLIGIKSELFKKVKGFSADFKHAYECDLVLRMIEYTNNIQHVARALYLKRALQNGIKNTAEENAIKHVEEKKAIQEHLDRVLGENAAIVEETEEQFVYDIRYRIDEQPLVSIIIPTKDHMDDLKVVLTSIFSKTTYDKYEIIILDNNSEKEETKQYFKEIQKTYENIRVVEASYEFNWSKLNNHGIRLAKGDVFVFLNNDVKVIEPTWLGRLVEHALQPNTGVVGGLLLYEDNSIQHAGVVIGMGGWADHVYKGMIPSHVETPFISPMITRNVTACTGACMAISRKTIEKIGDFDERFIICGSDVEICIRAIDEGYKNVYVPQVKLYHYESKSRDSYIPPVDYELSDIMYSGYRKGGDPYYNKNLSIESCVPQVAAKKQNNKKMKTKPVNLTDIREIHFRKEDKGEYRLNVMLPALNEEYVFGGIATALNCFEAIGDALGCATRIVLIDAEMDQKAKDKYGEKYQIVSWNEKSSAKHQIVSMVDRKKATLSVSENDQFMFTAWWSAYIVQTEYRKWKEAGKLNLKPFLYLIQDYEPGFYAWSPKYVLAETTYRYEYPQIAIFNSHELRDYILGKGYVFESVYCFEPLLNSVLKEKVQALDKTVYKRKQILVYGRPSVDRNAFEIIVESLRKWVAIQPGAESWKILSAGEQHDPVKLGEGLYLESVGKLTISEYAKMLQETYAGISLMVSPHPSYPPLEMAVFDVQVITNSYGNKDMSYFSKNITSVDNMDPVQIGAELKRICSEYRTTVPHKEVNHEYVYMTNPYIFIKDLKKEIMSENE